MIRYKRVKNEWHEHIGQVTPCPYTSHKQVETPVPIGHGGGRFTNRPYRIKLEIGSNIDAKGQGLLCYEGSLDRMMHTTVYPLNEFRGVRF